MSEVNDYEYFEVELYVVFDSKNDDKDYNEIIEAIRNVNSGNDSISHTSGANVNTISGKWSESELAEKIEKISKRKVANVNVGKFKAIKTSCQYFQVLGKQLLGKSIQERIKLEHIINCLHSETIIDS